MQAAILILGTIHLTGLDDWINDRQAELEVIVDTLSTFRPSRLALETLPEDESRVQEEYSTFLAEGALPSVNEKHQIGFRLARSCELGSVYGFDANWTLDFEGLEKLFPDQAELQAELLRKGEIAITATKSVVDVAQTGGSVAEVLRIVNSPEYLSDNHSAYVRIGEIGDRSNTGGAEYTASWYLRNLRMHANLYRIAGERERVFAMCGVDHVPILLELLRHSQRFDVVDARDYLPEP